MQATVTCKICKKSFTVTVKGKGQMREIALLAKSAAKLAVHMAKEHPEVKDSKPE